MYLKTKENQTHAHVLLVVLGRIVGSAPDLDGTARRRGERAGADAGAIRLCASDRARGLGGQQPTSLHRVVCVWGVEESSGELRLAMRCSRTPNHVSCPKRLARRPTSRTRWKPHLSLAPPSSPPPPSISLSIRVRFFHLIVEPVSTVTLSVRRLSHIPSRRRCLRLRSPPLTTLSTDRVSSPHTTSSQHTSPPIITAAPCRALTQTKLSTMTRRRHVLSASRSSSSQTTTSSHALAAIKCVFLVPYLRKTTPDTLARYASSATTTSRRP